MVAASTTTHLDSLPNCMITEKATGEKSQPFDFHFSLQCYYAPPTHQSLFPPPEGWEASHTPAKKWKFKSQQIATRPHGLPGVVRSRVFERVLKGASETTPHPGEEVEEWVVKALVSSTAQAQSSPQLIATFLRSCAGQVLVGLFVFFARSIAIAC